MEPSNRDRVTEGDTENPKENLRSGARGGGGDRALGLPRPGRGALCCPPSPWPARWVSVAARGVEGAGQPLLLCPSLGPLREGEEGGQKGQEEA